MLEVVSRTTSISTREWRNIGIVATITIIGALAYHIFAQLMTLPGTYYSGIHVLTSGDYYVYYSYIEQARQGILFAQDFFTHEHGLGFFNIFWTCVGVFAGVFHLNAPDAMLAVRLMLIPVFFFVAYRFIALYASPIKARAILFALYAFAGGLGVFGAGIYINDARTIPGRYAWPMDLWTPETFPFFSYLHEPHTIAGTTLLLSVLLLLLLSIVAKRRTYAVASGLLALVLLEFHPFHAFTLAAITLGWIAVEFSATRKLPSTIITHVLLVGILSAPAAAYYGWYIQHDFSGLIRAKQNILLMPPLDIFLWGFGLLLPFAIVGSIMLLRKRDALTHAERLVIGWFWAQGIVMWLPFISFQRRLAQGWWFPVVLLGWTGMVITHHLLKTHAPTIINRYIISNRYLIGVLFVCAFFVSPLFYYVRDVALITYHHRFLYPPIEQRQAADWARAHIPFGAVLLSAVETGNQLPGLALRRVYVGHGIETLDFNAKAFVAGTLLGNHATINAKKRLLEKLPVNYIWDGPAERAEGFVPDGLPLTLVYHNRLIDIYRVKI